MASSATKCPALATDTVKEAFHPCCGADPGKGKFLTAASVSCASSSALPGTPVSKCPNSDSTSAFVLKPKPQDEWSVVLPRRRSRARHGHGGKEKPRSGTAPTPEVPVPWAPPDLSVTSSPTDSEAVAKLVRRVRVSVAKLESSCFFRRFLSQLRLHPSVKSHLSRWCPEPRASAQMIVYGIGSIESYEPPRLQLALAILLHKELGLCPLIEIFDPVLSSIECAAVEELGCRVLSVDEGGRRAVASPILFYMPHCEAILYDNLLSANWDPASLHKMVLLGNSFQEYQNSISGLGRGSKVDCEAKYVLKASRIVEEVRIGEMNGDEMLFRAFHSTSWHFFGLDVIAEGSEFDQKDG